MTNSPPANVKIHDFQILASGIDTLYLALYVSWFNDNLFNYFNSLKEESKKSDHDAHGCLKADEGSIEWKFNIKPHGSKGFTWILYSHDYVLKIGNWIEPRTRPSIMVEIRSETLWRMGAENAVVWILELVKGIGTHIVEIKPSRVDLCIDMTVHSGMWSEQILDYKVSNSRDTSSHRTGNTFTGVSIGKGQIIARIYDKAFEITYRSKKTWMFDVWGINQVPEDKKIIRIEFQLRREVLKSLQVDQIVDLFEKELALWAYLTNWLKFQDRPGTHHTQRETLEWWKKVQEGYKGSQGANPAVRIKSVRIDKKQLALQMYGLMTSLQAAEQEGNPVNDSNPVLIDDCIYTYVKELIKNGKNLDDLNENIKRKLPRFYRPE